MILVACGCMYVRYVRRCVPGVYICTQRVNVVVRCLYTRICVCMHACIYECMYACMHRCVLLCMFMYAHVYACMYALHICRNNKPDEGPNPMQLVVAQGAALSSYTARRGAVRIRGCCGASAQRRVVRRDLREAGGPRASAPTEAVGGAPRGARSA